MRKYTTPEMTYKCFAAESVITASGEGGAETHESSAAKLTKELTDTYGVSSDKIVTDLW